MKIAILAAGEGTRLKREGIDLPKGLVELNGIPLIERITRIADNTDASSINCIVNAQSPKLSDYISRIQTDTPINTVIQSTPSSMHSLYELRHLLRGEDFCLFTIDTIFREEELIAMLDFAKVRSEYDAVMAVTDFIDDEKPLFIDTNSEFEITAFLDEMDSPQFVSGGIYYLKEKALDILEECISSGQQRLRNFQRMLIERDFKIKAYQFSKIIDIDHIRDIELAEIFLRSKQ